jgi:hypothetical protein
VLHASLLKHYTKSGSFQLPAPTLMKDEHASLLKHYTKSGSFQLPAPTLIKDEHLQTTVEMILDHEDTPVPWEV